MIWDICYVSLCWFKLWVFYAVNELYKEVYWQAVIDGFFPLAHVG